MTVADLLRGLEPRMFGATPERSWALRDRVAAYTRRCPLLGDPCFPRSPQGLRQGSPSSADQPTGAGEVALLASREGSPW